MGVEGLERRAMLAVFTVDTNADAGAGSLRQAILDANAFAGADTIEFKISTSTTISLLSPLPAITDSVLLDGTTQPGYLNKPIVEIDGSAAGATPGLQITSAGGGSTISALSIYGFQYDPNVFGSGSGVVIDAFSENNAVIGSYVGTNATMATGLGNAVTGILVYGLDTLVSESVIAGNGGVTTADGGSGIILDGASGTTIVGNVIGYDDPADDPLLLNAGHGILVRSSWSTRIGGQTIAERNVISGNGLDGVRLEGAIDTAIVGNLIGVDAATGSVSLANGNSGISLDADATEIGDGTVGGRNVISGNTEHGIRIRGGADTAIQGNYVGAAADGRSYAGNVLNGILVEGGTRLTIGGTVFGQGNVIGGNNANGILVGKEASDTLIQQNLIGLGVTLQGLGNSGDGVLLDEASGVVLSFSNRIANNDGNGVRLSGASNNIVGADVSRPAGEQGLGYGNAIYANGVHGVLLEAESNDNVVAANLVGLATPNGALQGNKADGIRLQASRRNLVGGTLPFSAGSPVYGNVIAANSHGVSIANADALDPAEGNVVRGNEIRNNVSHGIVIEDASNQTVGGLLSSDANSITLNGGNGIDITNGSRSILVGGNYVGTTASGALGLGNGGIGIRVLQSNASTIGGSLTDGAGNVVLGNGSDGIVITRADDAGLVAADASTNAVYGNLVRANKGSGIRITSASDNEIGKASAGFGNVVGNNSLDGLRIENEAHGNSVLGNTFGGASVLGNGGYGIRVFASLENDVGSPDIGAANLVSRNIAGGIIVSQSQAVDLLNGNEIVGNTVDSNLGDGIVLSGSSFQTVGGTGGFGGNAVTRNRGVGIRVVDETAATTMLSNENLVAGNFVGTDASGNALGNASHGIELVKASFNVLEGNVVGRNRGSGVRVDGGGAGGVAGVGNDNVIGSSGPNAGNTIVANRVGGILLENDTRRNQILGNSVRSNIGAGIHVNGSRDNEIGGGTSVTLSTGDGILATIQLQGGVPVDSSGTKIGDVFVGTDPVGTPALGNQANGVRLNGVSGVIVTAGSVIANNRLAGIRIENAKSTSLDVGNIVESAVIRGNGGAGITVATSTFQTVGGVVAGAGNQIESNGLDGITLLADTRSLVVQANTITANKRHGILVSQTFDTSIDEGNEITGNGLDGINISGTSTRNRIEGNSIGSTLAGVANGNARDGIGIMVANGNSVSSNLVAHNMRHGVTISKSIAGGISQGNVVEGNLVAENVFNGIVVLASRSQLIGGLGVDSPNIVMANGVDGILVGAGSTSIQIVGNLVGTDESGANGGNGSDGIEINNSTGIVVEANSVRFNDFNGLRVFGSKAIASMANLVQGNLILENDANGVQITASSGTTVGVAANPNTIGGNGRAGVRIDGASSGNRVEANLIGTNDFGADVGNVGDGVLITGAVGNVVRSANQISFNGIGVRVLDATATSLAVGNRIEANIVSQNDGPGIVVAGGTMHSIGGVGLGNTVVLNGGDGITIQSSARMASAGNLVQSNLIGTDTAESSAGNGGNGVRVIGGSGNVIDQNTISWNSGTGVVVAASSNNIVGSNAIGQGNRIDGNGRGVLVSDTSGSVTATTRGNVFAGNVITGSTGDGIAVLGSRTVQTVIGQTSVGGILTGTGNKIESNGGVGVRISGGAQQASLQGNVINGNASAAVVITPDSNIGRATVTISSALLVRPANAMAQVAVQGTLSGVTAGQQYQIDVFASLPEDGDSATGTGYGGRTFLGRASLTASANGTLPFAIQVSAVGATLGDFVTVMATNLRPPAYTSSPFSTVAQTLAIPSPTTVAAAFGSGETNPSNRSTPSRNRVAVVL